MTCGRRIVGEGPLLGAEFDLTDFHFGHEAKRQDRFQIGVELVTPIVDIPELRKVMAIHRKIRRVKMTKQLC